MQPAALHGAARDHGAPGLLKGIVMIFCDGKPLGVIAYTASIAGLRERAAAPGLVPVPARRCGQFRGARDPVRTAGTRLAAGMTDGSGVQRDRGQRFSKIF